MPKIATVMKASDLAFESSDLNWIAICDLHATFVRAKTKAELKSISTLNFCVCCNNNCAMDCTCEEEGN